jgi:hypothetical protein
MIGAAARCLRPPVQICGTALLDIRSDDRLQSPAVSPAASWPQARL